MTCPKIRYRDRIAAELALARITNRDRSHRDKTETRTYRCPKCGGGWHLTSKPRIYSRKRPSSPPDAT